MSIRVRKTDDLQAVHELDRLTFAADKPTIDEKMEAHEWWIAEEDGVPVGFIGLHVSPRGAFIPRVGVSPAARGSGLQKRLCRAAMRWARSQAVRRFYTYVLTTNIPSLRSLLAVGFKPYRVTIRGDRQFIEMETCPP